MLARAWRCPDELILQILESVELDEPEKINETNSPFYWCLVSWALPSAWATRLAQQQNAWNDNAVPLRQLNMATRKSMKNGHMAFRVPSMLPNVGPSRSSEQAFRPLTANTFYNRRHLRIFFGEDILAETWKLIIDKSQVLESLIFDVKLSKTDSEPSFFEFPITNFPNLTSFTLRSTSAEHWLDHLFVREIVAGSPNLLDLTVFQLHGNSAVLEPEREASCSLRSLYIRRFRECNEKTFSFIISKSHHTLEELTLVLDGPTFRGENGQRFHRGIGASELQTAIAPCTEIRTLRVADLVAKMSDYEDRTENVELDPEAGPLGFILDTMVTHLRHLEVLIIWGGIFSMEIFRNLETSGCQLKLLSIQNYPKFSVRRFLTRLIKNRSLRQLETLELGASMIPSQDARFLLAVCKQLHIELRILDNSYMYKYVTAAKLSRHETMYVSQLEV
ncbi:hypothetical protein O181_009942 [Austropuccinia psidii MF-1]|uniref:Uncharacterized protein n=1 Tax=Austropuccinia psidii MF-1 TaxID=1389203 RepID=A0A9Q3BRM8_9BASI|nr:hypothetical protein [Austropuccinia psidii MF-1]